MSQALADIYHSFNDKLNVIAAPEDGSLQSLVTFNDTRVEPIHRWYTFKEGYSSNLLSWLHDENIIKGSRPLRLLDPYMGVATSLLAAQLRHAKPGAIAVGIERNPAIRAIAYAKIQWPYYDTTRIQRLIDELVVAPGRLGEIYPIPNLSTLTAVREDGRRAFDPAVLQDLLYYQSWVDKRCQSLPERDFFLLAWTAIIGEASSTRKDGRALRLLGSVRHPCVRSLIVTRAIMMLHDVCAVQSRGCAVGEVYALAGDARRLPFGTASFSAACYSPPYLNNIDYSEVYKLELWLRGDVNNADDFRALRLGTLRSHPSIQFPETTICDELKGQTWIRRIRRCLLDALPDDRYKNMRRVLFSGYIDDMLLTLAEQKRVTEPGAPIVCVVGNSLHGGENKVLVCTDLIIAAAARAVGLQVERLQVARQLPRRDHQNGWLRETIIIMRNPGRKGRRLEV